MKLSHKMEQNALFTSMTKLYLCDKKNNRSDRQTGRERENANTMPNHRKYQYPTI